jgi:hypothetical protein
MLRVALRASQVAVRDRAEGEVEVAAEVMYLGLEALEHGDRRRRAGGDIMKETDQREGILAYIP